MSKKSFSVVINQAKKALDKINELPNQDNLPRDKNPLYKILELNENEISFLAKLEGLAGEVDALEKEIRKGFRISDLMDSDDSAGLYSAGIKHSLIAMELTDLWAVIQSFVFGRRVGKGSLAVS